MARVFEKPTDLSGYLFRITDNGGASADRYTIAFSDGSALYLSNAPTHPLGVSQSGEFDPAYLAQEVEEGRQIDLALGDLPLHIVSHILARENQGIEDYLSSVEACSPSVVAASRDEAEEHTGVSEENLKVIYRSDGGYMVRMDSIERDLGPFPTAREAVLATLPNEYSVAGPEYHSTIDVMRLEPDLDRVAAVFDLAKKVDEEYEAERAAARSPSGM